MLTEEYKNDALQKLNDSSPEHISETLSAIGSERNGDDWMPKTQASPLEEVIYAFCRFCEYCSKLPRTDKEG